jgi:hypothetical protein
VLSNEGIYQQPDPEVLERRLLSAQEGWDKNRRDYDVAAEFGLAKDEAWRINAFARENGLTVLPVAEAVNA